MDVRALAPGEQEAAAACLTDAFQRDALASWLLPDPAVRRAQMRAMFDEVLAGLPPEAVVEVTDDLGAVAIWMPPGTDQSSTAPEGASPAAQSLFAQVDALHPVEEVWYLHFLGARTPGTGAGSALLAHRHALVAPCALWTGDERNLAFYGRNGYRVRAQVDVDGASAWWMEQAR